MSMVSAPEDVQPTVNDPAMSVKGVHSCVCVCVCVCVCQCVGVVCACMRVYMPGVYMCTVCIYILL